MTALAETGEVIVVTVRLVPVQVVDGHHASLLDVVWVGTSLTYPVGGFLDPVGDLVPIGRVFTGRDQH